MTPLEVIKILIELFLTIRENMAKKCKVFINRAPYFETNSGSMFPGNVGEVKKIWNKIATNKETGIDKISDKLFGLASSVPFSYILPSITLSFSYDSFPDFRNLARVSPAVETGSRT